MTIVKRAVKGSSLTHTELDGNFTELEAAQASIAQLRAFYGENFRVIGPSLGDEPAKRLTAALAQIAAEIAIRPAPYCVYLTDPLYTQAAQWVIPTAAGCKTALVSELATVRRADATGSDKAVFFASGPGDLELRGLHVENHTPSRAWGLIPSGELRSAVVHHCRFGGADIRNRHMTCIRANRGGIASLVFERNTLENVEAGLLAKPQDTQFGISFGAISVSRNEVISAITELCSIDRGNGGAHGPTNAYNVRIINNSCKRPDDPAFLTGEYATIAIAACEGVVVTGNTIDGYICGIRLEDVAAGWVIAANTLRRGHIAFPLAVDGKRWWEYDGIALLDVMDGVIGDNVIVDPVYAGIWCQNNPTLGRPKRICIHHARIAGAGAVGIATASSPDSAAGVGVPNRLIEPYDDATLSVTGCTISHVGEAFAETGLVPRSACGYGIQCGGDYDLEEHGNTFLECKAAIFRTGRLARGTTLGPHRQTCLAELELHPTAPMSGVVIEGDNARGRVVEGSGHAGWVDVMDLGRAAQGILDIGFAAGDANYARRVVNLSLDALLLTEADLMSQAAGTLSGLALQLAADDRTLQARCATTSAGATHEWSATFRGPRFVTAPPAIIARATGYHLLWQKFDGASGSYFGPGALTIGNRTQVTISAWFQTTANPWANEPIFSAGSGVDPSYPLQITQQGNARLGVTLGANASMQSVAGLRPQAMHHLLLSADSAARTCWLRINGVDLLDPTQVRMPQDAVLLTDFAAATVGAYSSLRYQRYAGVIGDLWIAPVHMPDANAALALFRGRSRQPRYLGEDGARPLVDFGAGQPLVFLSGGLARDPAAWPINRGTAGGLTSP